MKTVHLLKNKYVSIVVLVLYLGALFAVFKESFYLDGWHLEPKEGVEIRPGSGPITVFLLIFQYFLIAVVVHTLIAVLHILYKFLLQNKYDSSHT